jgi:hypothetical protein
VIPISTNVVIEFGTFSKYRGDDDGGGGTIVFVRKGKWGV